MTLDLDPTEQRVAAALGRIARAHVPEVTVPSPPVGCDTRRRWLTLAVAASLVALLVGIVAVANRPADTPVITTPTTPTPSTVVQTPIDDRIAILDRGAGLGIGAVPGTIDEFLHAEERPPATWRFVRRGADGSVEGAFHVTVTSGVVVGGDGDPISVGGALGQRSTNPDTGSVTVTVGSSTANARLVATPDAADAATDWLDDQFDHLLEGWTAGSRPLPEVDGPDGFDALAGASSTTTVTYGGGSVTVTTDVFPIPVTVAELAAAGWPTAPTSPDGYTLIVGTAADSRLLWQAEPSVVVTVEAPRPGRFADHLSLVARDATTLLPVSTSVSLDQLGTGANEGDLTTISLIETSLGRFAYVEGPSGSQTCRGWAGGQFSVGSSECQPTDAPTTGPLLACPGGDRVGFGAFMLAVVIGDDAAEIAMSKDDRPVAAEVVRGRGSDGTPFTIAMAQGRSAPDDVLVDAVTVDGVTCMEASEDEEG